MATKFDYAFNPLATSQISFSFSAAHQVDDWDYCQDIRPKKILRKNQLEKFGDQMDKMLENQKVESIRKTMQMHEDVFKHQVRELHRVYNVQKMLMEDLKKEIKQTKYWSPMMTDALTQTYSAHNNFSLQTLKESHPNSREQRRSYSTDATRKPIIHFNLEKPKPEEDNSTVISTAINEDQTKLTPNGYDEDCEIELTLSIGNSLSNKKSKSHQPNHRAEKFGCSKLTLEEIREIDSCPTFKTQRGEECSDSAMIMNNSNARFDQERGRKHWLFESLKL